MPSRSKLHIRKSHSKSHNKQCTHNHNSKNSKHSKNSKKRLSRKTHNSHSRKHTRNQRGGFNSCSLATIQEPGFNIPAIGDVPGFSISQSKGAIYRPNCKSDSYQAMTPS